MKSHLQGHIPSSRKYKKIAKILPPIKEQRNLMQQVSLPKNKTAKILLPIKVQRDLMQVVSLPPDRSYYKVIHINISRLRCSARTLNYIKLYK
jgi:hypothetical protein